MQHTLRPTTDDRTEQDEDDTHNSHSLRRMRIDTTAEGKLWYYTIAMHSSLLSYQYVEVFSLYH